MEVSDDNLSEWDIVSTNSLESEEEKIENEEEKIENKEEAPKDTGNTPEVNEDTPEDKENIPKEKEGTPEDKEYEPEDKEDAPEDKEDAPEDKEDALEIKGDAPENKEDAPEDTLGDVKEDEEEEKEDIPAYDRSEVIRDEEMHGSYIEDIEPECPPHYEGSCSSGSEIDVIEEISLEDGHSHTYPYLDLSLSSSSLEPEINRRPVVATTPEVGSPPPVRPVNTEVPRPPPFPRLQAFSCICMCLFMVVLVVKSPTKGFHTVFADMQSRIVQLEAENKELKDQMLPKVDDDKLLVTMEKQISALKDENHKLSVFMQDLIRELEHQTIVFKKDSEAKGETSHQNEIDKLKEQVNILRIDNDELQKQLVRMRYGVYSPRPTDASDKSKKEESVEESNEQENATEIFSEEIKVLREKLISDVAKLSEWKKSVHVLMKGLENPPTESSATKSSKLRGQKHKGNRYEKFLKDVNDQFAEVVNKIPQLNISDLVHRYAGVDKKKVKHVFDSVNHFFKKAQEKTKDIFDENIRSDISNFIGSFQKQWNVFKKSFLQNSKKLLLGYNPRKELPSRSTGKHIKDTYHHTERKGQKYERNIRKEEIAERTTDIPSSQDQQDEPQDPQRERRGEATISRNSWVFERAAHRSENREDHKEEEEVNWFLRNKKTTETRDYFSMDENDHETDSTEPNDMFSMN